MSGSIVKVLLLFTMVMLGWGFMDFSLYYSSYLQGRFPLDKGVAVFLIACGVFTMSIVSSMFFFLMGSRCKPNYLITLLPMLSGFTNGSGYLAYYALARLLEASTLSPMVSMYILFPIIYGLTLRGEERSVKKLSGIALALASILMIAMGSEENYEVAADPYAKRRPNSFHVETIQWLVVMFISFGIASASGVIAGTSGQTGTEPVMILCSGTGFALLPIVILPFTWDSFELPPITEWKEYHYLLLLAGALFIVGASSLYGLSAQSGEISVVVPLTSLYTMVPTVLGFVLLDESMPPLKLFGIWCAFAAVYLLTLSKAKKRPSTDDNEEEREALLGSPQLQGQDRAVPKLV